ncbi:MAG TPA: hypothetical protein VHG31_03070 [Stellaceae bacterium]|nr:hypothetical protein [Stellaceae bacterium]
MRTRVLVAAFAVALALMRTPAYAVGIPAIPDGLRWGESSRALLELLGKRASVLPRPIDFGDSYVNVVMRNIALGGVPLTAFFQMDKATGGLKRVQFERTRHGVNPPAYRAVVAALNAAYGPSDAACVIPADPASGYQAATELVWLHDGLIVRAIFRDTTIAALESCLWLGAPPCGLTGQMLVRFAPRAEERPGCPIPDRS